MAKLKLEDRIASLEKALLGPSPTNSSQLTNEERVGWLEAIIAPSSLSVAIMARFALQQGWNYSFVNQIYDLMDIFFYKEDQTSYSSQDVIQAFKQELGLEQSGVMSLVNVFDQTGQYQNVLTKFITNQRI